MPTLGSFDVVVAVNVLHYADSTAGLDAMCRRIFSNLAPGGALLAYVGNAECDVEAARDFGFFVDRPADIREGDRFTVSIGETLAASVHVHHWLATSLARAVESAGFTRVGWEAMTHSDLSAGIATCLSRLLMNPPSLLLSAYRE